jgi:hypothetical protein
MNLKITFLTAFICVSCLVSAQEYKPFNLKGESLFMNAEYDVQAIRIDSVKANGTDTIYKNYAGYVRKFPGPFNYIERTYCLGSWIGSKWMKKNNGWCYFFNYNNDTLKFNLRASLYQSWVLYSYSNKGYLLASIASLDLISYSGITDSVKTINVFRYDSLGKNIGLHSSFKISKNNGFIELCRMNEYPDIVNKYVLSSAISPALNITNIQAKDVFDFQVGDEYEHVSGYSWIKYGTVRESYKIIVLKRERGMNSSTIIYTDSVYKCVESTTPWPNMVKTTTLLKSIIKDTIGPTNYRNLNLLPLSVNKLDTSSLGWIVEELKYDKILKIMVKKMRPPDHKNADHCLIFNDLPGKLYYQGLGGGYWEDNNFFVFDYLKYYKKGSKTWGTPLDPKLFLGADVDHQNPVTISFSPNPINTFATINIKNKPTNELFVFSLSDLQGNEVMHKEFTADKIEIEKGFLAPGLYVYTLKSQIETIKIGKVVIQ